MLKSNAVFEFFKFFEQAPVEFVDTLGTDIVLCQMTVDSHAVRRNGLQETVFYWANVAYHADEESLYKDVQICGKPRKITITSDSGFEDRFVFSTCDNCNAGRHYRDLVKQYSLPQTIPEAFLENVPFDFNSCFLTENIADNVYVLTEAPRNLEVQYKLVQTETGKSIYTSLRAINPLGAYWKKFAELHGSKEWLETYARQRPDRFAVIQEHLGAQLRQRMPI